MIYAFLTMTATAAIALAPQDNQSVPQTVTPQPNAPVPTQVQPPASTAPSTPPASAPAVTPPVVRPTLPATDQAAPAEQPAARPATRPATRPDRQAPEPTRVRSDAVEAAPASTAAPEPAPSVPAETPEEIPPASDAPTTDAAGAPVAAQAEPLSENATAPASTAPAERGGFPWLWLVLGIAVAAIGIVLFRRAGGGRDKELAEWEPERAVSVAAAEPVVAPTAEAGVVPEGFADAHALDAEPAQVDALGIIAAQGTDPDAPRALIDIAFRPTGAGTEVLEAVVDFEMDIMNNGTADAHGVQVSVWMSSASPYQDEEIAHFHANIPAEARMPAIEVPAGASRPVSGRIGIARQGIHVVTVRERPLFVPIVMLDVRWGWDGGEGHMQRAFVIGTGAASDKLGPIWLDRGPRIHTDVGARVHSESVSA